MNSKLSEVEDDNYRLRSESYRSVKSSSTFNFPNLESYYAQRKEDQKKLGRRDTDFFENPMDFLRDELDAIDNGKAGSKLRTETIIADNSKNTNSKNTKREGSTEKAGAMKVDAHVARGQGNGYEISKRTTNLSGATSSTNSRSLIEACENISNTFIDFVNSDALKKILQSEENRERIRAALNAPKRERTEENTLDESAAKKQKVQVNSPNKENMGNMNNSSSSSSMSRIEKPRSEMSVDLKLEYDEFSMTVPNVSTEYRNTAKNFAHSVKEDGTLVFIDQKTCLEMVEKLNSVKEKFTR